MRRLTKAEFIQQQGFTNVEAAAHEHLHGALTFQPKLIGILLAAGIMSQSWSLFLVLAAILWWSAAVPRHNPFDMLYNGLVARRREIPPLPPAPPPRRFAQGEAGTFALAIGFFLLREWNIAAWILEGTLAAAVFTVLLGRFCFGAYTFQLLSENPVLSGGVRLWERRHREPL